MLRDDLIKALEVQPHNTDCQVDIAGFPLDVVRVNYDEERAAIVLSILADDIEDLLFHAAQRWHVKAGTSED